MEYIHLFERNECEAKFLEIDVLGKLILKTRASVFVSADNLLIMCHLPPCLPSSAFQKMKYLNLDKTHNGEILEEFYCNFVKVRCLYNEKRHAKDIGNLGSASKHLRKISKEKVEERTNVILLLDGVKNDKLIGGVVLDYYGGVNQAVIRCIVVDETVQRKEEYFQGLLDEAFRSIMLVSSRVANLTKNHVFRCNFAMHL